MMEQGVGSRRWKPWHIALTVFGAAVFLATAALGVDYWRRHHQPLVERVRLQIASCNSTAVADLLLSMQTIEARLDDVGIDSYHFSQPDHCHLLLDLPERQHLADTARTITAGGQFVVYGMGSLPHLAMDARFPYTSDGLCEAAPPCIVLTGDDLDRGSIGVGQDFLGQSEVTISARSVGSDRLAEYTSAHIGQSIAIVIDGRVLTDPTIQEAIDSGSFVLNNIGGADDAKRMASMLRHPPLPATLSFVSIAPLAGR
jgi:preprotein translocase subunit SecD